MKNAIVVALLALAAASSACGHGARLATRALTAPGDRLTAFGSEEELQAWLRDVARQRTTRVGGLEETVTVTAEAPAVESVTNVQEAGVDEGGIVKVSGDHLVVLRRGRLFTVRIGDDAPKPVSMVDAFAPGLDPRHSWYDEMLISGRTIVVLGYSYQRGGTELGIFDLDRRGILRYRATYHLASGDYYSSRNYASRLIGTQLIFYSPLPLDAGGGDPGSALPRLRLWRTDQHEPWRPIYSPRRIYRPFALSDQMLLHTVTTCDISRPELTCQTTSVVGPWGNAFYVARDAVYVWTVPSMRDEKLAGPPLLYRMPLDGTRPGVVQVSGGPVDQFSFLERDGFLNVVVRTDGHGDGMWAAESAHGEVSLMRVPVHSFGARLHAVAPSRYRALPTPTENDATFQNRFVGSWLLYGTGDGWWDEDEPQRVDELFLYRFARKDDAPRVLHLGHTVDRIDALGGDAVVVGTRDEDLHVTTVSLSGEPTMVDSARRPNAAQGELRSQGFFYRADGTRRGTLGLPIRRDGEPGSAHLVEGSAAVLFLRNDDLRLVDMGELEAASQSEAEPQDGCRTSCVDWYGNARPLFLRGRVFALLGYELVEGQLDGDRIVERRRVSFAPVVAQR